MALNVSVEPKENRQLTMKIEVEQARVEQELRKAARKVAGNYRVPGFRPGKAPYSVLVQYVGLPTLFNEFIEPLGEELYKQALEQEGIEPYAQAALDIASLEPLTYELIIPLEPEVNLGDYRSLRVEQKPAEIEDSEVEEELEKLRKEQGEWTDLDRASAWGDTMVIDVRSVIVPDAESDTSGAEATEETVVLDENEWEVTLDEENPLEPAGFDAELLGMSAGEEKEFLLSWPEDSRSIYKGKQARFTVKVHKVQGESAPELSDEFAQSIGPDFETLEDLKAHLRETLQQQRAAAADEEYLESALDKLVEQSTLVYPPAVVEDQIDSMIGEFGRQLRQYGIESVEAFLARSGQSMEQYRENLREQAEITARRNLVISELYRVEGIEVSDDEIEERIKTMLGSANAGSPQPDDADLLEDTELEEAEADSDDAAAEDFAAEDSAAEDSPVEASAELESVSADAGASDEDDAAGEESFDEELADAEDADAEVADNEQYEAFRDMMLRGPGRQILESQILQEKSLERLLAIARGEELPPVPEKKAPAAATEEAAGEAADEENEASAQA